ncbi:MAG TPA: hypothetical protein VE224_13525, partial [Pseudolabrys sp.]|nr:hypothetical protein [Pseudolabrys sp.]
MKIAPVLLATALAVVTFSASSVAQSRNRGNSGWSQSGSSQNGSNNPDQNGWSRDRDWNSQDDWNDGIPGYGQMGPWMMGGQWGRPGWMGHGGWHDHNLARGARFIFRRGNALIDIRCPADQSVNDCVGAAGVLIDKIERMKRTGNQPPRQGPDQSPPPQHG